MYVAQPSTTIVYEQPYQQEVYVESYDVAPVVYEQESFIEAPVYRGEVDEVYVDNDVSKFISIVRGSHLQAILDGMLTCIL